MYFEGCAADRYTETRVESEAEALVVLGRLFFTLGSVHILTSG